MLVVRCSFCVVWVKFWCCVVIVNIVSVGSREGCSCMLSFKLYLWLVVILCVCVVGVCV